MGTVEKIDKYLDEAEESDEARKARLDKVIKATPKSGKNNVYTVELIGDEWPSEWDLVWYCDYPNGAPEGGRVKTWDDDPKHPVEVKVIRK